MLLLQNIWNYENEYRKKKEYQHLGRAHVTNQEGDTSDAVFLSCHKIEEQDKDL
jgi:hypothetical protein